MMFKRVILLFFVLMLASVVNAELYVGSTVKFAWNASPEPDLKEYELYQSNTSGKYDMNSPIIDPIPIGTEKATLTDVKDGIWFWIITVSDKRGNRSPPSNEVTATIDTSPDAPLLFFSSGEAKKISQENWKIYYVSSEETKSEDRRGIYAIDGKMNTQWHTGWLITDPKIVHPHELQIDLGRTVKVSGFTCLPRQDKSENGMIKAFRFFVSMDGTKWNKVAEGELLKTKEEQTVSFPQTLARYVSIVALSEVNGKTWTTIAELNVMGDE